MSELSTTNDLQPSPHLETRLENSSSIHQLNDLPLSEVRFRCPNCRRLYVVSQNDIKSQRPEFNCLDCANRFGFINQYPYESMPETFVIPQQNLKEKQDSSVFAQSLWRDKVEAFSKPKEIELPMELKELDGKWSLVMDDFENEVVHNNFLEYCFEKKRLVFASQKYIAILSANPNEDIANKMLNKASSMVSASFFVMQTAQTSRHPTLRQKKTQYGMMFYAICALGSILVIFGVTSPVLRSLVALGTAVLFMAFGFRIYLQK